MMKTILPPDECTSMAEVRAGVDALDEALVRLMARRFGYMDAAARIKTDRDAVRDEARKQDVLDHVEAIASGMNLPAADLRQVWDKLVESSIAYELARWDKLKT